MNRQFLYVISIVALVSFGILFWNSQKGDESITPILKTDSAEQTDFSLWQDYAVASNPFSAKLPVFPQHVSEKGVDPKSRKVLVYDIYASETLNSNVYGINIVKYPEAIPAVSQNVLMARIIEDMIAQSPDNHLVFMNQKKFNDLDAYDFEIETPKKIIRGKTFIRDRSLYVLTGIYKKNHDNVEEYNYFIQSFQLNEPLKPVIPKVEK